MDTVFSASFLLVLPFWFLMIVLPTWRFTERVIRSPWTIAPAALLYAVLVLPRLPEVLGAVANPDLAGVSALLGSPAGATIGWVHFLAFDLFVARWAYLDSRERNVNPFVIAPVLVLVLMLGPIGFLAYLAVRQTLGVRPTAKEATA